MKIIGFADKGIVKQTLRDAGVNPVSVRKVVVAQDKLEVYFHNGDKMVRVDSPSKLIKVRK